MSFLDALTGGAYQRANRANQQLVAAGFQQGGNALQSGANSALQLLLGGNGAPGAQQVVERGFDQAGGALGSAYTDTTGTLQRLGALYEPLTQQGQGATTRYLNATGANGAAGSDQATADFREAPGYTYARNQALGAVQRSAAARGNLAGGTTTQGILDAATGLADRGFQQYIDNLRGASGLYQQGIAGQAGALQGQANASQQYGNALGALDTGRGSALAGILGSAAGVQQKLGTDTVGLINSGNNLLGQSSLYAAKGQTDASNNALGALAGGANLLAGGVGGAGGLGALGALGGTLFGKTGKNGFTALGRNGENALADAFGINPFGFG